ncbi:methyl-accepting chemotaxis protein [Halovenus sp. HT40]|uniref:methyl-accepting chemotaxis protein n=1 Tax=Halovenus sp. HT40 TaxID=3126691 RepID=UPI00300ED300
MNPQLIRERRLVKFGLAFGVVILVMITVGVLAFLDTAAQIAPENRGIVAQNLAILIATAVLGIVAVGLMLARPTVKGIEELASHTADIEAGQLDGNVESAAQDELGSLYRSITSMRETIKQRIEEAEQQRERALKAQEESETQRERAEQARQESEELARTLETRTEAFAQTMAETANGDLTARLSVESDDPESLTRVGGSFNEAMDELQAIVDDVGTFTEEVVTAGEASTDRIDDAVDNGRHANESMDDIAADARQQRDDLVDASEELESMSANIEEVAASTDELADSSKRAAELSERGRSDAVAAVKELHSIEQRSESAVETITELETQMDEIEQIVTTITEIAEQTNMLALNASIEAARAGGGTGDVADGFDVVAQEVKALAEETRTSASEIEEMLRDIRHLTEDSADDMRGIQTEVKSGVETVENVGDVLTDIDTQVGEVDDGVQQITIAMDQQATSLNDVTATVDELTEFGRTTAEKTTAIAETASEQVTILTGASENTHALLGKAKQLQESLGTFTYEASAPQSAPPAQ